MPPGRAAAPMEQPELAELGCGCRQDRQHAGELGQAPVRRDGVGRGVKSCLLPPLAAHPPRVVTAAHRPRPRGLPGDAACDRSRLFFTQPTEGRGGLEIAALALAGVPIQPLPVAAPSITASAAPTRRRSARRNGGGHQARRGRLVDPGDDRLMQVVEQVASLAPARLHGAEAAGEKVVAAARAGGPALRPSSPHGSPCMRTGSDQET